MRKIIQLVSIFFLGIITLQAQNANDLFQKQSFSKDGKTLPYRIMYPKNYDASKKYPLVIFLHGSGERGTDNEKQLANGAAQWLVANLHEKHQAIVIAPQCPENDYWANAKREVQPKGSPMYIKFTFFENPEKTQAMQLLEGLIDQYVTSGKVNKKRVYVGGLSMGGLGTYELLARYPKKFAAAYIICGAANLDWVAKANKKTPLWIFHGTKDAVVSFDYYKEAKEKLNNGKRPFKYTEYEGVNHNSWDNVFKDMTVFDWIFSFKK